MEIKTEPLEAPDSCSSHCREMADETADAGVIECFYSTQVTDVKMEPSDVDIGDGLYPTDIEIKVETDWLSANAGNISTCGTNADINSPYKDDRLSSEARVVLTRINISDRNNQKCNAPAAADTGKMFTSKNPLLQADPRLPYKCYRCYSCFDFASKLLDHVHTHPEPQKKPFECRLCSHTFPYAAHLKCHIIVHHSREGPHYCKKCHRSFDKSSLFSFHMKKHRKPHKCEKCENRFPTVKSLTAHMKSHSPERTHQCKMCDRSYIKAANLKIHMWNHTGANPYLCPICSSRFARSSQLKGHMKSHAGLKPYYCELCNHCCFSRDALAAHMLAHTGLKPFHCTLCVGKFGRFSHLQRHMKTHKTGAAHTRCTASQPHSVPTEPDFPDVIFL